MKRLLAISLTIVMLLALTACGGNAPADNDGGETTTTTATEATTTTTTAAEDTTTATGESETTTVAPTETEATTTTSTTAAPTTTTTAAPTYNKGNVPKKISILAVGNSFSVDAMKIHLYPMLKAAGCTDIRLGILYIGGASLDTHYDNIRLDRGKYEYYETTDGNWSTTPDYKASAAFALTQWDIVTVQQVSGHSGRPSSYANLDALMDLIQPQIGDAKVYWQMTWAYQQDSTHADFGYYNKDQMKMYKSILTATKQKIINNPDFTGYFPCGTAIQNMRTSSLGDTLTADGYHLKDSYGDYTAALTWFCTLTGADARSVSYRPGDINAHFDEIAEAVNNAIANPLIITECK